MSGRVLHIATHLGGGVGKVLSGVAAAARQKSATYQHRILLLERPEKMNFVEKAQESGTSVEILQGEEQLWEEICAADILQIEWWHHPKMADFLAKFPKIPVRALIWAHISGCYYPYLSEDFLRVPGKFVFTSPYSLDNPGWTVAGRAWAREHCAVVHSAGGFSEIAERMQAGEEDKCAGDGHCVNDKFVVGYVGTQSFSKMHRDFVQFCAAVADLPGISFRIVGDMTNREVLLREAERFGIAEKFVFVDYVNDVAAELRKMDVFGYLLSPIHFGTTENALLEAMAAALPVVALRQCAEKYLIRHGETGFLVESKDGYREIVRRLYALKEERTRIGRAARADILRRFSVEETLRGLYAVYDELGLQEKKVLDFTEAFGNAPSEFFLNGLPLRLREIFLEHRKGAQLPVILTEKSKSSLPHFARVFPQDRKLREWEDLFLGEKL